jgi:spermidine/putrescine transport system ATP-binding protein
MDEFAVELIGISKLFGSGRDSDRDVADVVDMQLAIEQGEFFTLLGPSGCGKTTTLRLIAGFETPTRGEIHIQGRPMSHVPPNRRPVNTVFQNYALFPHLTVAQNVEFGLTVKRVPREERSRRVREAVKLVQLEGLESRKPVQLSGGQQQRVALARALINRPAVLLLDEPLGALDLKLRKAMQLELKHLQLQVGITFIYVTHDQEEALTMSDRIAVMHAGHVLQVGRPMDIYENPSSRFVADFVGETNFLDGRVEGVGGDQLEVNLGDALVGAQVSDLRPPPGEEVTLVVRPEKLSLAPLNGRTPDGLHGTVTEVVYIGTDTRYVVCLPNGQSVVARIQNVGGHRPGGFSTGDRVQIRWDTADARVLSKPSTSDNATT